MAATLHYCDEPVRIVRRRRGRPHVECQDSRGALFGLGWLHGRDRGAQIEAMRLAGQGRLCECLRDSAAALASDMHYRRMGFARDAAKAIEGLPRDAASQLDAYCAGINAAWKARTPLALRLAGHRPGPFEPRDALLLLKLLAYVGLAEARRDGTLFLVHACRRGMDTEQAAALFPHLGPLDAEVLKALRSVPALRPGEVNAGAGSNAWVVDGTRTASGAPVLANDPHLEVNRLPPLLYEVALATAHGWAKGASIPGIPGMLSARGRNVAWGVTYSFGDTSDFFVEECERGRYRYGNEWYPFAARREHIVRRAHTDYHLDVYTNHHGVLEGDPYDDGYQLCWRWVGQGDGGLGTLSVLPKLLGCRDVGEADELLRHTDIPTLHVVLADTHGNIGYRFTGAIPRRLGGPGVAPVPGWTPEHDWHGRLEGDELPAAANPQSGFIVSANEPRETPDGVPLATFALAPYRYRRIEQLIQNGTRSAATEQAVQCDCISQQAIALLPIYLRHVPAGPQRELLAHWDGDYATGSKAATLFDNIHHAVLVEVFGRVLGREWFRWLLRETGLVVLLARYFDDVLLRGDPHWLPRGEAESLIEQGVRQALTETVEPWGRHHQVTFENLFFKATPLGWLSATRGPYALPGNHATPRQGTVMRAKGRQAVISACYRLVTDMATATVWSAVPGGPSEVPGTRGYRAELRRWLRGRYKGF